MHAIESDTNDAQMRVVNGEENPPKTEHDHTQTYLKIPSLSNCVGVLISTSRSKRPGRRRAGSSALGRLVAARTTRRPRDCIPSMSVSSCATTRLSWLLPGSRRGHIASISSINRTTGSAVMLTRANWRWDDECDSVRNKCVESCVAAVIESY